LLDPPKFTQIGIFGLKRNHLATLVYLAQSIRTRTQVIRSKEINGL
jgi:hypothetical protein